MFNQIDTTENHLCLTVAASGQFCEEWQVVKESTHNYMNTIVLVLILPLFVYWTIRLFLNKK